MFFLKANYVLCVPKIALLAIGGNALLKEDERGLQEEQLRTPDCAEMLARVVAQGYSFCVVHGNGPQVGNLPIQQNPHPTRSRPATWTSPWHDPGVHGYMLNACS